MINNGTIIYGPDTTAPFAFGTNATYSCDGGFFFEGNEVRTCIGDGLSPTGSWTGANPICSGTFLLFSVDMISTISSPTVNAELLS